MKKKKQKHLIPKLSAADKAIYFLLIGLLIFSILPLSLVYDDIINFFGFTSPDTVAFNPHFSTVLSSLFFIFVFISAFVSVVSGFSGKYAIIGNKKIRYGEYPWKKDFYPLFDKRRKSVRKSGTDIMIRKILIRIWIIILLVNLALFPFGLHGRDCLQNDNTIVSYNFLNQKAKTGYNTNDYSCVTYTVRKVFSFGYRSRTSHWTLDMTIEMKDGSTYTFENSDFKYKGDDYKNLFLRKMIEIKQFFTPDNITVKGKENADIFANNVGLNEAQIEILDTLLE